MITALDLISTPVGVLNATALETRAGISGDDPLCERLIGERLRVFVSLFAPNGTFVERRELDPIAGGERRMINLSEIARPLFGNVNVLSVVHRIPYSVCPPGQDPAETILKTNPIEDYDLLRTMIEYGYPGRGRGGVIYETPPGINSTERRGKQSALILSSKVAISEQQNSTVLLINMSQDFAYRGHVTLRARLFAPDGQAVAAHEERLPPFSISILSIRDWLTRAGKAPTGNDISTYSVVAWSKEGALIPLFLQTHEAAGSVSIEHSNPPQVYLLPKSAGLRFKLKNEAVASWDRNWPGVL
jgi:hypothetical protein